MGTCSMHERAACVLIASMCIVLSVFNGCSKEGANVALASAGDGDLPSSAALLANMPMNQDLRCTGICMVAEALLHVQPSNASTNDTVERIGQAIFQRAVSGTPFEYRPEVLIDGKQQKIWSKTAQDHISRHVTELYKKRYQQLASSLVGRETLRKAYQFVLSESDLDRILQQYKDQIELFAGMGTREFSNGERRETNHVFLVAHHPDGQKVVYDPNDPGRAIPCKVLDSGDGLRLLWQCRYKDTGEITTQSYYLIEKNVAFGSALAVD
jgi:hypothetical protein